MDVREILEGFAQGRISRSELERTLGGFITIEFDASSRSVEQTRDLGVEVAVRPTDVRARLEAYLRGEITAEVLSEWASLILLIDAFIWPGHGFAESTPGERAWLVLEEPSAPVVHGSITQALAQKKLELLRNAARLVHVPAV